MSPTQNPVKNTGWSLLGHPCNPTFTTKKVSPTHFPLKHTRRSLLGTPCTSGPTSLSSDQPHPKKLKSPQTLPILLSLLSKHTSQTPTLARPASLAISTPASRHQPISHSNIRHERSWVFPPKTRAKNKK